MSKFSKEEYSEEKLEVKNEDILAKLAGSRIVFISEPITTDIAKTFSAILLYLDHKSKKDITVYINTDGGDLAALLNMYDIIQMINSNVKTICIGKAYSTGAFLLAAGTTGKRFITKNAQVMLHGLQCDFPAEGFFAKKDSEIYYRYLDNQNKFLMSILTKHTGHDIIKLLEDTKRDFYLTAQEALEYGLVDAII